MARHPRAQGQAAPDPEALARDLEWLSTALADSGTDDPAQGARFFLGRIAQHHLAQSDPAEAARQFRGAVARGALALTSVCRGA